MTILQQMTYDLMGIKKNAYDKHFGGLNEDTVIEFTLQKKLVAFTRMIYQKNRYVKYMCGDMDAAAKHHDLQEELNANCAGQATNGKLRCRIIYEIDLSSSLYSPHRYTHLNTHWIPTPHEFRPSGNVFDHYIH